MSPKPLTKRPTLASALVLLAFCGTAGLATAANKPQVVSATVDFSVGYGQLTIAGENLPSTPDVKLGGTLLDVLSNSSTEIVASLQAVAGIQNLPGDYQLSISQGSGASNEFVVTIGATGPEGPRGARGDKEDTGPAGRKLIEHPAGSGRWRVP